MSTLTIDLPPTVTKEEATFLLAVALYGADRISLGKAAELAGIPKRAFMERLVDEGVPVIDDDPEELERELGA
jgi:predicted HTH domain antitoxin